MHTRILSTLALLTFAISACSASDSGTAQADDTCTGTSCDEADAGGSDGEDVTIPDTSTPDTSAEDAVEDEDVVEDTAPDVAAPDAAIDASVDVTPRDSDGDGVIDDLDEFPDDPTEWADADGDGVGDNEDACDDDPSDYIDTDGDGACDASDDCPENEDEVADFDGDGVCDLSDAFPEDPEETTDTDGDGIGNNADDDDDNDGLTDIEELEPGADCLTSNPLIPDTDNDTIFDAEDPYPRDPYAEFLLRLNDEGTLNLFLSNRDGSFQDPVPVGDPIFFDDPETGERRPLGYGGISIGDFDNDGRMDFVAHSSQLYPDGPVTDRYFYFFFRDDKEDEFRQVFIGITSTVLFGVATDLNGDFAFDLIRYQVQRDGYVDGAQVTTYINTYTPRVDCVWSYDAEDGCFFTRLPDLDVTDTVSGEWTTALARTAVDFDPDTAGGRDLTIVNYSSGGNGPGEVYTLFGNDDGTFGPPTFRFNQNQDRRTGPANTILLGDFNNDGIGDMVAGFDDDGSEAGLAQTYFGVGDGTFSPTPVDAVDINPDETRGSRETLGRTSSGRSFDFDFDGNLDLVVGYDHIDYGNTELGQTRFYRGNGDGTFGPEFSLIGAESYNEASFAIPERLCPTFEFLTEAEEE